MATDRIRLPHVGALDGLRGAAVAGVVLFHGGHLTGGYLGVDLFFVLSGYLITSLLLAEWRTRGRISLANFWARRARRLLPALVLVIAAVALYCVLLADRTELARIRGDALATIGYVANWRAIFRNQSYFEILKSVPSPLDHTWSLAIEEQFYVIWPLLFVGLATWWKDRLPQAVLVAAIALGSLSTVLMAVLYDPTNVNRAYYGTDTRAFALFAGIALAAAVHLWGHARGALRVALEGAGVAAVALLAYMWIDVDGQTGRLYRGGFFAAGIAAAVLIAVAANPQRGPIGWVLSFAPLRWLGLISYGLYLWHWPIDVVLDPDRVGLTGWPLFGLRTAVALAIAFASYSLLEMPIRRGALRARQWRIAIPAIATVLVAAVITTTLGARSAEAVSADRYAARANTRVLLVGDSVAQSLASGLDNRIPGFGLVWSAGCRLIHGTLDFDNQYSENCDWEDMFGSVVDRIRPRYTIVLMGTWDLFNVRLPGTNTSVAPGDPRWNQAYARQLERLIRLLRRSGSDVVLLTIPCSGGGLLKGPAREFLHGAFDVNRVTAANAVMREVAAAHPGHVHLLDLFSVVCPNGRFAGAINGVVMRTDGVHFSEGGARLVSGWLVPQLVAIARLQAGVPGATTTSTSSPPAPASAATASRPTESAAAARPSG
jgi:peptidoglycan/LPS O-acetylase OafA/YrhL